MTPRIHGNGFIQLDLNETTRLHIWGDPRIPRQQVATPIHTHVFDFTSEVLKGRLIHIEYNVPSPLNGPNGSFKFYEVVPRIGEDTELRDTGQYCNIRPYDTKVILPGQSYSFTANRFHENFAPEPTVTIMKKRGPTLAQNLNGPRPMVLVPSSQEPDNSFNRYDCDQDTLWDIIEEHVKSIDKDILDQFNKNNA